MLPSTRRTFVETIRMSQRERKRLLVLSQVGRGEVSLG
jgi:hypothetical protein